MTAVPYRQRLRSAIGSVLRRKLRRRRDEFIDVAKHHCQSTQSATFQRVMRLNEDSNFSQQHGLTSSLSIADFQRRFPVSRYDMFRPAIDELSAGNHAAFLGRRNRLLMFAITSGTTSASKLIPVTQQFVADYRRGWQNWGITIHDQFEKLKLLKMVQMTSNHQATRSPAGTPIGNISGLVTAMQNPLVRKLYSIPADVAQIEDHDIRRNIAALFAVADPWAGFFVTANPSSLLKLLQTANERVDDLIADLFDGRFQRLCNPAALPRGVVRCMTSQPERARQLQRIVDEHGHLHPASVWPDLCVLGVWKGGSVSAYLPELKAKFGNIPLRDHGLHASEGRMTLPLCPDTDAGILEITSTFFEFIPEREYGSSQPIILQAHELTLDQNYYILLTTSSGLCRYDIQDVVRCTGFFGSTPQLIFLHKGAHISSITGEKLSESQVVDAVQSAVHAWNQSHQNHLKVGDFSLTPEWRSPPGYTLFMTECLPPEQALKFSEIVEKHLGLANVEYREKRESGRLSAVKIEQRSTAKWQTFSANRLRSSGGSSEQYKHPFLLPDPNFQGTLRNEMA